MVNAFINHAVETGDVDVKIKNFASDKDKKTPLGNRGR